jgi:tetratricopeptide (TPR) repeat protein
MTTAPEQAQALLEAATRASQGGDGEQALLLLRRCVEQNHVNPAAHYLLGAEYAQGQRYGDAVVHLTTAVEQAPSLWIARLQLGLLWLTLSNPTAAITALHPLHDLPETDALHHFGRALTALCGDDLPSASSLLQAGLQVGSDNAPLLADMQRLLDATLSRMRESVESPSPVDDGRQVSHDLAISAYSGRGSIR